MSNLEKLTDLSMDDLRHLRDRSKVEGAQRWSALGMLAMREISFRGATMPASLDEFSIHIQDREKVWIDVRYLGRVGSNA